MLSAQDRQRRVSRRALGALAVTAGGLALAACGGSSSSAAPAPEPTAEPTQASPYQIRVTMRPQDARLGTDENVVVHVQMVTNQGRPVSGATMSAVVNYPSGPKTFKSDISTFPDGVLDLAVPVVPATRGSNVRVEVTMGYQGGEYKATSGFTVR